MSLETLETSISQIKGGFMEHNGVKYELVPVSDTPICNGCALAAIHSACEIAPCIPNNHWVVSRDTKGGKMENIFGFQVSTLGDYYKALADVINSDDYLPEKKRDILTIVGTRFSDTEDVIREFNRISALLDKEVEVDSRILPELPAPDEAIIVDYMKQQKKISAIKHYRSIINTGLKEAKERVELCQND